MKTDPQELVEAFQLFNEVSGRLTLAYEELRGQVAQLNHELADANLQLRRQLEEKERLSRRLDLLLSLLPGAVIVLDENELIQDGNPEARRIFGETLLKGTEWRHLAASRLQSLGEGEWRLMPLAAGMGEKRLSISSQQLPEQGGRILLVQDVTEAQRMREAVQRQKRLSAMGEMLANLAHQLRTPLAAAMLYASQLNEPHLTPEDRARFQDRLIRRLQYLEKLINDMLRFVKGEADSGARTVLMQVLDDVAQVMEPVFKQKKIRFHVDNQAGDCLLTGSREVLAGVLTNILSNAAHFSPAEAVVSLVTRPTEQAVEIRIQDRGPGISPAQQERLFEPFFTTRAEGTGLGLAIVREVVTQLGGAVWAESEPGRGALFGIRVPLAARQDPALSGSPLFQETPDKAGEAHHD